MHAVPTNEVSKNQHIQHPSASLSRNIITGVKETPRELEMEAVSRFLHGKAAHHPASLHLAGYQGHTARAPAMANEDKRNAYLHH